MFMEKTPQLTAHCVIIHDDIVQGVDSSLFVCRSHFCSCNVKNVKYLLCICSFCRKVCMYHCILYVHRFCKAYILRRHF